MLNILLFILLVWLIWSPMVVLWVLSLLSENVRSYSGVVIAAYASFVLAAVLALTLAPIAGVWVGGIACLILWRAARRATLRYRGQPSK